MRGISDLNLKTILLSSLFINAPLIRSAGVACSDIIVINVSESIDVNEICHMLSEMPFYIDGSDRIVNIKSCVRSLNCVPVIWFPNDLELSSYSCKRIINYFIDISKGSCRSNDIGSVTPVIICSTPIPDLMRPYAYEVFIQDVGMINRKYISECVPTDEDVYEIIGYIREHGCSPMVAAAYISAMCFDDIHEELFIMAEKMDKEADNAKDSEEVIDEFLAAIRDAIINGSDLLCALLPEVSMACEKSIDSCFFLDMKKDYLYISEKLFSHITADIQRIWNVQTIKAELAGAGILIRDRSGKSSSKMLYYDIVGQMHRPRMLKFSMNLLNEPCETDIKDLCRIFLKGEKNEDCFR